MSKSDQVMAEMMKIFKAVDKDGSGRLDKKDVKSAMEKMAKAAGADEEFKASPEEADAMVSGIIGELDIDSDGVLGFDELMAAFASNIPVSFDDMSHEEFVEGYAKLQDMATAFEENKFCTVEVLKTGPTTKRDKREKMRRVLNDVMKSEEKLGDFFKTLDLSQTVFLVTSAPPCGEFLPVNAKPVDKVAMEAFKNREGIVVTQTPDGIINVADQKSMEQIYLASAIAVSKTMKSVGEPIKNIAVVSSQFWHVLPKGARIIFGPQCSRSDGTLDSKPLDAIEPGNRPPRCLSLFLKDGKFELQKLMPESCVWFGQLYPKIREELFSIISWVLFNTTCPDLMRKHCVTLVKGSPKPYQASFAADPWTFFLVVSSIMTNDLDVKSATIDDRDSKAIRWVENNGRLGAEQTYYIPQMGDSMDAEQHQHRAMMFLECWKAAKLALEHFLEDRTPKISEVPESMWTLLMQFPKIEGVVHDFCHNDVDDGSLILIIKAMQCYAKSIGIDFGDATIIEASRAIKGDARRGSKGKGKNE